METMASTVKKATKPKTRSAAPGALEPFDPLEELDLDPHNPRLGLAKVLPQPALINLMLQRFKVEDVADSILASGWQPFDPLIGYRTKGRVALREGNRRLTALKLLLDPSLAPETYRASWEERSGLLTKEQRDSLRSVAVYVVDDLDDPAVEAYVGFRHVTGVLEWPAEQKAAFIAELIERHGWTYEEIAERLGSYPRHVEKHFVAYRVAAQAKAEKMPGADRIKIGILLRALQTQGVRAFLGVEYPENPKKSKKPVPPTRESALKEFVRWVFGTKDALPIMKDSRQLTKLGSVLQSNEALRFLRSHPRPTLDRAWVKSGGMRESLVESLAAAADRLEESVPQTPAYARPGADGADEVQEVIGKCVEFLALILRDYPAMKKRLCSDA